MEPFESAARFMYRCARPLDLARWQFHFEGGERDAVLRALSAYQNADGGFGHALEADSFNPNSCPIQTWAATEILRETGADSADGAARPIVQGILRYLDSGADFDEGRRQWRNAVPSNNDFPCAAWWKCGEDGGDFRYNPTAALAGFALRFAAPESRLYALCLSLAGEAADWLGRQPAFAEQHIAACFIRLYEDCAAAGVAPFDADALLARLREMARLCLEDAPEKWGREYAAFPSDLISSPESPLRPTLSGVIAAQCDYIRGGQLPDGSFPVPWTWYNDDPGFPIAELWWKGDMLVKFMRFLRAFGE